MPSGALISWLSNSTPRLGSSTVACTPWASIRPSRSLPAEPGARRVGEPLGLRLAGGPIVDLVRRQCVEEVVQSLASLQARVELRQGSQRLVADEHVVLVLRAGPEVDRPPAVLLREIPSEGVPRLVVVRVRVEHEHRIRHLGPPATSKIGRTRLSASMRATMYPLNQIMAAPDYPGKRVDLACRQDYCSMHTTLHSLMCNKTAGGSACPVDLREK